MIEGGILVIKYIHGDSFACNLSDFGNPLADKRRGDNNQRRMTRRAGRLVGIVSLLIGSFLLEFVLGSNN